MLGPLKIQFGDEECVITSPQVRALLALLALHPGRVMSAQSLMSAMWDGDRHSVSKNALQAAVTRLRRHLRRYSKELPLLKTSHGGYVLDVMPFDVDVFRFTTMVERADALRSTEPVEAVRLLSTALQLWRGPALDAMTDLPVLRAEQVRLNEARLAALETMAELRLESDQCRTVLSDLQQLVELHPDRERLGELLMIALYRAGRQREALDVFHRIRVRLDDELGIDPGRGLKAVYAAILSQDPSLEAQPPRHAGNRLSNHGPLPSRGLRASSSVGA